MIDRIYLSKNGRSLVTGMSWTSQQTETICLLGSRAVPIKCSMCTRDTSLHGVDVQVTSFDIDSSGDLYATITTSDPTVDLSNLTFIPIYVRNHETNEPQMVGFNIID